MDTRKSLIILISHENYLRNWIGAEAFKSLSQSYQLHYVIAKDYWNPNQINKFGVTNFEVAVQPEYRKLFLRHLLSITMFKHAKKSRAFKIKLRYSSLRWRFLYEIMALPGVYEIILGTIRTLLPRWTQFESIMQKIEPVAVIAPSLAADSFTIDMTHTAKKLGIKSILLINSWDNLVSKGVLPIPPDCLVVWGQQGVNQAVNVQNIAPDRLFALGNPRFDRYFCNGERSQFPGLDIHDFNGIPANKNIILYAATSIPFDDISAIEILDRMISSNKAYSDYVILFRPHPEMMKRHAERSFEDFDFNNVYLDQQVADYYHSRFGETGDCEKSFINDADLDYYPALLKSVVAVVCPPTTLGIEGAMNGIPCLMICYGDGRNLWLSPDQVCQYENVEEVLEMPGVVPCRSESDLENCFKQVINFAGNSQIRKGLAESTNYLVYRDSTPYSERLRLLVDRLIQNRESDENA